jgi:hypothetical protein
MPAQKWPQSVHSRRDQVSAGILCYISYRKRPGHSFGEVRPDTHESDTTFSFTSQIDAQTKYEEPANGIGRSLPNDRGSDHGVDLTRKYNSPHVQSSSKDPVTLAASFLFLQNTDCWAASLNMGGRMTPQPPVPGWHVAVLAPVG